MAKVTFDRAKLVTDRLRQLKSDVTYNTLFGNYKEYKKSVDEFSKLAVDKFEYVSKTKSPTIKNAPLFSKIGFNIMKIWFLNLFRKKSPEEKLLSKMFKEYNEKNMGK